MDVPLAILHRAAVLNERISESEVVAGLASMKRGKAVGPDGIHGELLKDVGTWVRGAEGGNLRWEHSLAPVLHAIYSYTFRTGDLLG